MDVYTYRDDLDKGVPINDRDAKYSSYVIGFRKRIEADWENANLSARILRDRSHLGITLPENLFLELGYFLTTGGTSEANNLVFGFARLRRRCAKRALAL